MTDTAKRVEISESGYQPPATISPMALTPMDMLSKAVASGASMEVLEKLMALQERWEKNQARKAFDEAMSAAKAEIPTIIKNRQVGFESKGSKVGYRYEDLAEIARTVDPILGKHGLSYRFRTTSEPNEPITVTCIVSHRLGHSEENTLRAGRDDSGAKNALQAIGSTLSYLQKYTLKAALGLAASNDDDGKSAGVDLISEEQHEKLMALITEIGTIDLPKFLKYLKVGKLEELQVKDYQRAIDAAESKRAKK